MTVRSFKQLLTTASCVLPMVVATFTSRPAAQGGVARSAEAANAYLSRLEKFGFTGSVLVARDGTIEIEGGYGFADRAKRVPFTKDTVIDIGSVTKTLTQVAIAQLAQQKVLSLDDSLKAFFPDVPADKAGVTVRQLLAHRSGLGLYVAVDRDLLGKDEFLSRIFSAPLLSPPGSREEYSNPGYTLLAAIIEQRTGLTYERYLADRMFKPAGMRVSGYALPTWSPGQLAHNYNGDNEHPSTFDYPHPADGPSWTLRGNGGTLSTVGDMYKFHLARLSGVLLPSDADQSGSSPFFKVGSDGVHFFVYSYDPAQKLTVLAASTDSAWRATEVATRLTALLKGESVAMPPEIADVKPEVLARLAGTTRLASGAELNIEAAEGRLIVKAGNEAAFKLLSGDPDGGRAAPLGERMQAALTASGNGDYKPFYDIFQAAAPFETFSTNQSAAWRKRVESFGAFRGATYLGATAGPGGPTTIARLDFEHGVLYAHFIWGRDRVMGFSISPAAPATTFRPRSAREFVSFDLPTERLLRLRVPEPGTKGAFELDVEQAGRAQTRRG